MTGNVSGLGRATADRFAEAGVDVAVTDIDADGGEETVERIEANNGGGRDGRVPPARHQRQRSVRGVFARRCGDLRRDGRSVQQRRHRRGTVRPGVVDTVITDKWYTESEQAVVRRQTAFGRCADPVDVASCVAFLAS
ncbi:SDR family NAD(P)-dependent oxidoreductase [Natrinema sp. H-ect4]|uniref:SDR family NAD(P)-dependent oxidoreductase n=1 Tax=Natrinema sp. H-ect4 TaxID=3242699 RepID=UPI0035A94C89